MSVGTYFDKRVGMIRAAGTVPPVATRDVHRALGLPQGTLNSRIGYQVSAGRRCWQVRLLDDNWHPIGEWCDVVPDEASL